MDTHTSFDGVANAYTDLLCDEQLSLSTSKNSAIDKRNPHSHLLHYYENDHRIGEKTQLSNPCSFFFCSSFENKSGPDTGELGVRDFSLSTETSRVFFVPPRPLLQPHASHISVQAERKKSLGNFSLFKSPFLTLL